MKYTRRQNLEFHIRSDDYFGTLATVLSTLQQVAEKNRQEMNLMYDKQNKQLQDLKSDLMWLQENYKVIKK